MNTDGTGFHTYKEYHKTESLWSHTTTDHKEGEQLEDRRSVGASNCNSGDGTDQRVQSLMFMMMMVLCLWFHASVIFINNCPTRCIAKQSIYYSASSLYMFRVSIKPIIRSAQNCNYSLRYCAATSLQRGKVWPRWREVAAQYRRL